MSEFELLQEIIKILKILIVAAGFMSGGIMCISIILINLTHKINKRS